MRTNLQGKVAIVTGGTRGIGAAIVQRLAEDGAAVGFSYVASPDKAMALQNQIEAAGGRALAIKADAADPAQVAQFILEVKEKFGRVDILVNSAGLSLTGAIDDPSPDLAEFERQFAVNVTAVATAVRTALPFMGQGGRIVNIGTVFAERSPLPGFGDYAASKGAIAAYTRSWARDLGPRGITVNVVQPGPIDTEMNPATSDHAPLLSGMTALGRYGRPDEIASVVAFLVSDEASYVSGVSLNVDGGMLA